VESAYLFVNDKSRFNLLAATDVVPLGLDFLYSTTADNSILREEYLYLIPPIINNVPEFAFWTNVTNIPGLTITTFGKGTAMFFPWAIVKLYYLYGAPVYKLLLQQVISDVLGPLYIMTNAPASVELTVYMQQLANKKHLIVHLLNACGLQSMPLTEIIPVANITVSFLDNGMLAGNVQVISKDTAVTVTKNAGYTHVTVAVVSQFAAFILD